MKLSNLTTFTVSALTFTFFEAYIVIYHHVPDNV